MSKKQIDAALKEILELRAKTISMIQKVTKGPEGLAEAKEFAQSIGEDIRRLRRGVRDG